MVQILINIRDIQDQKVFEKFDTFSCTKCLEIKRKIIQIPINIRDI